jgi:hypothetical protein
LKINEIEKGPGFAPQAGKHKRNFVEKNYYKRQLINNIDIIFKNRLIIAMHLP